VEIMDTKKKLKPGDWLLFRSRGQAAFCNTKKQPVPEKVACPRSGLRRLQLVVAFLIFSVAFAGFARVGPAAEATPFLVSYGGTAGYQLPL
jgi:hypothetical protein